ncbi:hypothetical protein IAT40_003075 [Kwoniella sp. CBS 6097]
MSPFSTTSAGRVGNDVGNNYKDGTDDDRGYGYGHVPSQSQSASQSQSPAHSGGEDVQNEGFINDRPGSTGHTPVRGLVKRPRQACTNCRALKTRCLPYGSGSMKSKDTCSRCAKYGLKCDYERKPRGKVNESEDDRVAFVETPSGSVKSGPSSTLHKTNEVEHRVHYGVDEMKDSFRPHECSLEKYGQWGDRNTAMGLSTAAGATESGPSSWAASHQPDTKPLTGFIPHTAPYQYHDQPRSTHPTQTSINSFSSGQPPTFYDVGNRTNSLGCPAVPTHVAPPNQQNNQADHQHPASSTAYSQTVLGQTRKPSTSTDCTYSYPNHASTSHHPHTPSMTNSSTRSSTTDVKSHLPSIHPAAGGTYVRSRKTAISTLITDHLDPHLGGRDDSRSPSPDRTRRYSNIDYPTTSSSSSRLQSHASHDTSKNGSARNSIVRQSSVTSNRVTVHPIDLGMLSEPEARYLYNQFFTHLSDIISCFDAAHTTYERARSSPSLFTAMLFASARFFRPDLSPTLRSHAEVLVNRAVTEGLFDLPTIQALLVLAYWKLPKDGTAYIKLGIAIRAACQLRLWKKRTGPLPAGEEEARAVLDRERTWMCMDRAYSHIFEQPVMVPNSELQLTDGETWAFEHEHLNITVDWYLAWHACMHMPMDAVPMQRADNDDEGRRETTADAISPESYLMSSTDRWANGPHLAECHKRLAYIITTMMIINIRSVAVQINPNEKTVDDLIRCAEDLADRLAVLAARGVLPYWSETAGTGISLSGSLLYKSRAQFNHAQIDRIIILLKRFIEICNTPFDEAEDHALHYIQRFYRRLIPVFQDLQRGNKESEQVQQVAPPDPFVYTQQQTSVSAPWDQLMGVSSTIDPQWTMLWGFDMNSAQASAGNGINNGNTGNNPGATSFSHDNAHSNGHMGLGLGLGVNVNAGMHNGNGTSYGPGQGQGGNPPVPPFMSMANMPTQ